MVTSLQKFILKTFRRGNGDMKTKVSRREVYILVSNPVLGRNAVQVSQKGEDCPLVTSQ
jgi:hypothetical protein